MFGSAAVHRGGAKCVARSTHRFLPRPVPWYHARPGTALGFVRLRSTHRDPWRPALSATCWLGAFVIRDFEGRREGQSGNPLRSVFGVLLFAAYCVETVIWVGSTVHLAGKGHVTAVVSAIVALALITLLAGMEGLEVSVIDRWRELFAGKTTAALGGWLSARQLFVALIVTSATLLAHRSILVVPFTSTHISGALEPIFDLTWTGFTVLWFAQIVPKVLAATDPERYLRHLRRSLFPLVEFVRVIGVSQPGEWTASLIARRTGWIAGLPEEVTAEEPSLEIRAEELSLAGGWRAVITRETDIPAS